MSQDDFDLASLATYLHVTPQQIEKLATRGKVPGRKVQGQWRFSSAEIHHWMEERMGLLEEDELYRVENALEADDQPHELPLSLMVHPGAIAIPLAAKTKRSVIEEMVGLAVQTGMLWDAPRMIDAVTTREELQSTAMPNGVALLHPRRPLANILGEPLMTVGVSPQGIPFGGGSSTLTYVFFLICSTDDRGHLHTLARLTRMLQSDIVAKLRDAQDDDAAREIFEGSESDLR